MMIEDDELRELYKSSTSERLRNLEDGLMHLEKNPQDTAKLEEFLREAHTLKGDSRMLGLNDIETLVHQLEDCLAAIKRGENSLTPQLCDRLYQGLDAVGKLVHEAITGEAANINTFLVLAALMGADEEAQLPSEPSSSVEDDLFGDDVPAEEQLFNEDDMFDPDALEISGSFDQPTSDSPTVPVAIADSVSNYQIDTIRVEPQKLDALLSQAGELTVTKLRITRQMAEIEQILSLWSEWQKATSGDRSMWQQLQRNLPVEQLEPLQSLFDRTQSQLERLGSLANQLRTKAYEDSTSLEIISNRLESGIRTLRLLPLSNIFSLFPRMVRDLAKQQGKKIDLVIEGGDTTADKRILSEIKDPLLHIIRNAIDHGIETPQERENLGKAATAIVRLRGYQQGNSIIIEVSDDGRGLNLESIKQTALARGLHTQAELEAMTTEQIQSLIFASGFSTRTTVTEISGRGVGLDVVRANIERLKGTIEVTSMPGKGSQFRLKLATTLATTKVLIVAINNTSYAIPVEAVERLLRLSREDIFALEGKQTIVLNEHPVSVVWLADILELSIAVPSSATVANADKAIACIILKVGNERLGILVEQVLDQQDIILKPQSKLIKRVRNIAGATILSSGEVCMVVNPQDILQSVQQGTSNKVAQVFKQAKSKLSLLLVEDSIVIRTQMKRILEGAGYKVTAAVDGQDGFNKLRAGNYDGVVSDVEMPNLDGLSLTARIRQYSEYNDLPVILVTTLAKEEDKRRGAQAGANAYLTKGDFDQKLLLETLQRLI